jgi:SAM-dependent methyltransferase
MNREEWNPGKLLDLSGNYWATCALHAGVKLGIFSLIGRQSLNGEEIAQKINGDPRGVSMLLNALTAMDLLTKRDGIYANTLFSSSFLSKESPQYIGFMIMHHHHLMPSWAQLDQAVATGRPIRGRASFEDETVRESFLMGMFNMAMMLAPHLASVIDLSGKKHLVDLGGGPGTYAIHFCLKNPGLKATVYDLETTRPFAEKTIARFGLRERIDFQDGNYVQEDIRGTFDVAWLSQILHGEGPEEVQRIIRKAVTVLEPGGQILVHEFLLNNTQDGPLLPALFSLNMLLGTAQGQSYSEEQIMDMLAKAGAKEIHRLPLKTPNDSGVILGTI